MYELLPFQGSARDHDDHHSINTGNYGSLFTLWDTLMGTHITVDAAAAGAEKGSKGD